MSKSYNLNSEAQLQSNLKNKDHLIRCLLNISHLPLPHINIGDYGCSTGRNSFIVFRQALSKLREVSNIPVFITHEDQPSNPWNEFFKTFEEVGYGDIPDVYTYIAGKSFYEQIFPNNYLHIAYSNSSLHYAKKIIPCPDHTSPFLSEIPEIREAAIHNGKADLREQLELRARELAPGGYFIINCLLQCEKFKEVFNLRNEFNKSLVKEGFLKQQEFEKLVTPMYPYSMEDWNEVLNSLAHVYRIEHLEVHERENPIYARFLETGDEEKYADEMTGFVRAWFEVSLRNCLIREEQEKDDVVEEYFKRHREFLRHNRLQTARSRILLVLEVIKTYE